MNLTVKRFPVGHPMYSDAKDSAGLQPVFGQMFDDSGNVVCYTLERRDTLIPEGTYNFGFYFSPANKAKVPLLQDVPGFEYIEIHIANYPRDLKGCTAVGIGIEPQTPMITSSGQAFSKLMGLLNGNPGTVTYSTLQPAKNEDSENDN